MTIYEEAVANRYSPYCRPFHVVDPRSQLTYLVSNVHSSLMLKSWIDCSCPSNRTVATLLRIKYELERSARRLEHVRTARRQNFTTMLNVFQKIMRGNFRGLISAEE